MFDRFYCKKSQNQPYCHNSMQLRLESAEVYVG